jgi:hypothetical protein
LTLAVGVAEADGVADVDGVALTVADGVDEGLPQAASASRQARAGISRR